MTNQTVKIHHLSHIKQHNHASDEHLQVPSVLDASQPDLTEVFAHGHTSMHQRLEQFLKTIGAVGAIKNHPNQPMPDVLFMDETEFKQRMSQLECKNNPKTTLQLS